MSRDEGKSAPPSGGAGSCCSSSPLFCLVGLSAVLCLAGAIPGTLGGRQRNADGQSVSEERKSECDDADAYGKSESEEPGKYTVEIQIGTKTYRPTLQVVDTQPPEGTALDQTAILNTQVDAASFVSNIQDATAVTVTIRNARILAGRDLSRLFLF